MDEAAFLASIAEAVDRRRDEITRVKRVVSDLKGSTLETTAAVMALPMFYAHWEGFVKEALQMYVEYVEKLQLEPADAHPVMYSFSMKRRLRKLLESGSIQVMADFASWMIESARRPLMFEDKSVETGSNLSYENLLEACSLVRVDVQSLHPQRRKINKLVHRRNNIAHTGRPLIVTELAVEEDAKLTLDLIEEFERNLRQCVLAKRFAVPPAEVPA